MSDVASITMTSKLLIIVVMYLHLDGVISDTLYDWDIPGEKPFNYNPRSVIGVNRWASLYQGCRTDDPQSPVNIDTRRVRYGVPFRCPRISYNNNIIAGTLKNNGHSTTFTPTRTQTVTMINVPYNRGMYIMHEFHVHYGGWSRNGSMSGRLIEGSEHEVNGRRYSGEFHFVFYNSRFTGLEQAFDEPGGVTIVSVFAQRLQRGQKLTKEALQASRFLENNMPAVSAIDRSMRTTVDFSMFFNRECDFYTYSGSTTTPVCHPNIRWVILRKPMSVTNRAWQVFRLVNLMSDFSDRYGNHRPVQPLNGRVIEANFGGGRRCRQPSFCKGRRPISGVRGRQKGLLMNVHTKIITSPHTSFFNALPPMHMAKKSYFKYF